MVQILLGAVHRYQTELAVSGGPSLVASMFVPLTSPSLPTRDCASTKSSFGGGTATAGNAVATKPRSATVTADSSRMVLIPSYASPLPRWGNAGLGRAPRQTLVVQYEPPALSTASRLTWDA